MFGLLLPAACWLLQFLRHVAAALYLHVCDDVRAFSSTCVCLVGLCVLKHGVCMGVVKIPVCCSSWIQVPGLLWCRVLTQWSLHSR